MKAIVKTTAAPGGIAYQTVPIPEIGAHEILVKVKAAALCGTDLHIKAWNEWAQKRMQPPVTIGHEFAGEVVEIGAEVHHVKVGDRVSAESHIPCNRCQICREGFSNVCPNTKILGVSVNGCFADYVAIPEEIAFVYPDETLPWEQLSLMEPFGVAVHGMLFTPLTAKHIAISGAGPLGCMSLLVAKQAGAAQVIVIEPNPVRAQMARELGANVVIDPTACDVVEKVRNLTDGYGVHLAADCTGNVHAIRSAMAFLRPGGTLSCIALPSEPLTFDVAEFGYKGCELHGVAGRDMYRTWEQMRGLLRGGLDLSPIVSHVLPLKDFEQGVKLMEAGECCKCVFIP